MTFLNIGIKRKVGKNKSDWTYTTLAASDTETITRMIHKLIRDDNVEKVTITKE